MTAPEPQFLDVVQASERRRIAYRHRASLAPGLAGVMWFIGLKSDMDSTKAVVVDAWCEAQGRGCTRFDYSGHGLSEGSFETATVSDWIDEAHAIFAKVTQGPQIFVGSSTGAHVALVLLRRLLRSDPAAARVRRLVLIAPAWDVTELIWRELPEAAKAEIVSQGQWVRPSPYDPRGYVITRRFIEDGRRNLIAADGFDPGRRIDVLQGLLDTDVPPAHVRALAGHLSGGHVHLTEVPDGDHRLSRPEDIELLLRLIGG
ncbi:MAG: alpha/beta hydrolase [Hyphomicrobium sp.]